MKGHSCWFFPHFVTDAVCSIRAQDYFDIFILNFLKSKYSLHSLMSLQHSSTDGNPMKSRSKKCMNMCDIPFRLVLMCTFSSLFVFTPTPHPANHTSQRPLGLMLNLRNGTIGDTKTVRSPSPFPDSTEISRNVSTAVDGLDGGCNARCGGIDSSAVLLQPTAAAALGGPDPPSASSSSSPVVPPLLPGARAPYIPSIHQLSKDVLNILCRSPPVPPLPPLPWFLI